MDSIVGGDFEFDVTDDVTSQQSRRRRAVADVEDAPVVRFLQKMLIDAINLRASDMHFEPYEYNYRVRFRVDGELREIAQPPLAIKDKLASRIKVISRLDISEKRVPQDGRMKLKFGTKADRLPRQHAADAVRREDRDPDPRPVAAPSSASRRWATSRSRRSACCTAIGRPYGMVLVTGPTGSGKTVSLYTCLNILNQPGVNISTAEDPAEINLPGVNQVNVNDKAGLTFAAALKSFLRQDPDIIMVGEIRDLETADIAIKAAQTGHMVLSTLHTNDAPTTLTRLLQHGRRAVQHRLERDPDHRAAPGAPAVRELQGAGRLSRARRCSRPASSRKTSTATGSPTAPVGCSACNNGYKGRVGIYQVMPITEEIQQHHPARRHRAGHRRAGRSRRRARPAPVGPAQGPQGMTSLEEVISVTNE